jgi:biotin operon repressor
MSSEWVKAGKLWRGYCEPLTNGSGKSRGKKLDKPITSEKVKTPEVSDVITRAVMRELCLICHDSGLVMVTHSELARRVGVSYYAVKRAIHRLTNDGYLVAFRRGSGSKLEINKPTYTNARANAYLMARLPDEYGYKLPPSDYLEKAFFRYVRSPRYNGLNPDLRQQLAELVTELYDFGD